MIQVLSHLVLKAIAKDVENHIRDLVLTVAKGIAFKHVEKPADHTTMFVLVSCLEWCFALLVVNVRNDKSRPLFTHSLN